MVLLGLSCLWSYKLGDLCIGSALVRGEEPCAQSSSRCLRTRSHDKVPVAKATSRVLRFELDSGDSDATDTPTLPCTPRQALRLGEILASELEHRTMEPLVTRKCTLCL